MYLSNTISQNDLDTLNLLVPSFFRVQNIDQGIHLQFYSPPETGHSKLLFDFEISPASSPDFSGALLPNILEDLAGTVLTLYNEYKERLDLHPMKRILQIVNGASRSVSHRLLLNNEYRILTHNIYTVDEADWFG